MNALFAFGCSLTFGHGLKDCWDKKTQTPGKSPSQLAWPQLLANKINRNCVNLSNSGASNKEILFKLENWIDKISVNDLVIIKWSYSNRWCVIEDDHVRPMHIGTKQWKNWQKDYTNEKDSAWLTKQFIDLSSILLNERKIKYFHLATDLVDYDNLDLRYSKFVKNSSIIPFKKRFPRALDGSHPGEEAHNEYAKNLCKIIGEKYEQENLYPRQ